MTEGKVLALSVSKTHSFKKFSCNKITLKKGLGVAGDAHMGTKVKHRYLVAQDPDKLNLRQVHLIHFELFKELEIKGFGGIKPGDMGENITTSGLNLLKLPRGTLLSIGNSVKVEVTGLRNPCYQLNSIKKGLLKAVIERDDKGNLIRKVGIMGIVIEGGNIIVGDVIRTQLPKKPFKSLEPV
jgi:hypothetical protein